MSTCCVCIQTKDATKGDKTFRTTFPAVLWNKVFFRATCVWFLPLALEYDFCLSHSASCTLICSDFCLSHSNKPLCMFVHICMCVLYEYTNMHIYIYVFTYICIFTYVCVWCIFCKYIYICIHTHMYIYIYLYIYVYIQIADKQVNLMIGTTNVETTIVDFNTGLCVRTCAFFSMITCPWHEAIAGVGINKFNMKSYLVLSAALTSVYIYKDTNIQTFPISLWHPYRDINTHTHLRLYVHKFIHTYIHPYIPT